MSTTKTLNTFLGLREKVEGNFRNMLDDMFKKFKNNQGLFMGQRKTYVALDGFADEPTKRGFINVQSTVDEQLKYMTENTKDFLDIVFSIEKTNASGTVTSELIVEGESWGEFTSLELLRLKTTLDNSKLKGLYANIPVRTSTDIWNKSEDEDFADRDIYENSLDEGYSKTTIKESYILSDPHAGEGNNRAPIVGEKSTQVNTGKYSVQMFSGAISLAQRATMLKKYNELSKAVIEALQRANQAEIKESDLGSKIFEYIHS